jgi:uncharacterized protein (DUF1697 family)
MTTFVALLRAVNLGGSTQIGMASLRELLLRRGYERVETLLQSGNVVLRTRAMAPNHLERQLESDVVKGMGFETEFFVRTADEWRSILEANPFPAEAERDPGHLLVTVLKKAPPAEAWTDLARAIAGREKVQPSGREGYFVYPDGIGRSKLTTNLIERKLGTRATSRNWNTVQKLDQLASS